MTLVTSPMLPNQRAEIEAAFRSYYAELEPEWREPPGYFEQMMAAWFSDPDRWLWWGLNEAGRRVGFVVFRKFRDWPDQSRWVGSLCEFCIFPPHRRNGYGTALARRALETLRAAGCRKVEANVLWQREVSLAFWKSLGFKPTFILTELGL